MTKSVWTLASILVLSLGVAPLATADKRQPKPACPEGYTKANLGFCYRIDDVKADGASNTTMVTGELISSKSYAVISYGVSLFRGVKVACKAVGSATNVEKNQGITFQAACFEAVRNPDKMTFRIDAAM